MSFANELLSSDGMVHQAIQSEKHRTYADERPRWYKRNQAREAEEIEACLHCKRKKCTGTCPEMVAIRKKYRRKRQ